MPLILDESAPPKATSSCTSAAFSDVMADVDLGAAFFLGAFLAFLCILGPRFDSVGQTSDVVARIELEPIETLRISDFDPIRPSAAPVVFRVYVTAGMESARLRLQVDVESQSFGFLGSATKELGLLSAGQSVVVTNQDFDTYELADAGNEVIDLAAERGLLPPDDYFFFLSVIDVDEGGPVGTDSGVITTTNTGTQLEIVGPGTPLDQEPDVLSAPYPIFQWFSDASRFNFALYEVKPGQSSAEDIVASLPVFEQQSVPPGTFVYPNAAEELVTGRRYAWQIEAITVAAGGDEIFEDGR